MSKFYTERESELRKKYGLERLETTDKFEFSEPQPYTSKFHQQYLDGIRRKFGLSELQLETPIAHESRGQTVSELQRERETFEARGARLEPVLNFV